MGSANLNRRSFLQSLAAIAAACAVPWKMAKAVAPLVVYSDYNEGDGAGLEILDGPIVYTIGSAPGRDFKSINEWLGSDAGGIGELYSDEER